MKRVIGFAVTVLSFVLSLYIIILTSKNTRPSISTYENNERSGALEALDFWTRSRAYPDADIPSDKFYKAYSYAKSKLKQLPQSIQGNLQWESIGPTNLSGRTISIAINPLNGNTVYVGAASGGLWRSYTGGLGADWKRVSIGYPVLGVGAIAINPNDSNIIYIGTGEVYRRRGADGGVAIRTTRGSYGIGILKTTNGGTTWTKSLDWSFNQERGVQALRINPLNPNTVWAATTEGIFKSTNAGTNWVPSLPGYFGEDIIIHSTDTNLVLVSCGNFGYIPRVLRTTDGGISWNQTSLMDFSGKTLLEMYAANPNVVYASVADSTLGITDLWRSTDFGLSWTLLISDGISGVQGWYSHFVAVHPTDSSQIVHAGVNISKSTNGGLSFSYSTGSYADHHGFAHHPTDPNILYVVNDDGVYRSTNFGSSYTYVSNGMSTGQFYNGFSNSSTDSLLAIGQVQDHIPGYIYQGNLTWGRSVVDECGWTAINPLDDNTMYAVNRSGGSAYRSTNRGLSFSNIAGFGGTGSWNSPLVVAPSNPSVLYVGKDRVYKSLDAGASWSSTNTLVFSDGNLSLSMAMSYTNPDTVYVGKAPTGARAHLYRTTNGGDSWTDITGTTPDRYPMDIAVDPNNSRVVFAVFAGANAGHVFKSTDAGTTWNNSTGNLPDIPTTAIIVDPQNSNYVYVGNDIGVYASTNGGTTWNAFSEGLPDAILISDLTISPSNRMLRATTHGNGVFQRKMFNVLPVLVLDTPNGTEQWDATTTHLVTWSKALVSTVRLEYSTDNGANWVTIVDNIPSQSQSYQWQIPYTLTTQARVRVVALADTTFRDESDNTFTITFHGSNFNVNRGWNLTSLPITVNNASVSNLFPVSSSMAFAYEGTYNLKDTLKHGPGYWIKFPSNQAMHILGDTIITDSISVAAGWNLIGSITIPVATTMLTSDPPGIVTSNFFGYEGHYEIADTIFPGNGYWVKVHQNGKLILSSSGTLSSANSIRILPSNELPPSPPEQSEAYLTSQIPHQFGLEQNYPNPFNPTTVIRYQISEVSHVTLNVYNTLGEVVATLVNQEMQPGFYSRTWNANNLPSGLYFYKLAAGSFTQTKKLLLLR